MLRDVNTNWTRTMGSDLVHIQKALLCWCEICSVMCILYTYCFYLWMLSTFEWYIFNHPRTPVPRQYTIQAIHHAQRIRFWVVWQWRGAVGRMCVMIDDIYFFVGYVFYSNLTYKFELNVTLSRCHRNMIFNIYMAHNLNIPIAIPPLHSWMNPIIEIYFTNKTPKSISI